MWRFRKVQPAPGISRKAVCHACWSYARPPVNQSIRTADPSSAQVHARTHRPSISTRRQSPSTQNRSSRHLHHFILVYSPFGASPKHELSSLSHRGSWSPSDGDHSFRRLIAVTRVPEGASPRILVSPVALHGSVKVETSFLQHPPPPPSRSAYLLPQAALRPLRPLSPEQKSFRPDLS